MAFQGKIGSDDSYKVKESPPAYEQSGVSVQVTEVIDQNVLNSTCA